MKDGLKFGAKKKLIKRVFIASGIFIGLIVVLMLVLPFFLRGKIKEIVKAEINKQIVAKADFEDVSVSFFRSFPRLNGAVENLTVKGIDDFKDTELISIKKLSVDFDLFSALFSSKPLEILSFSVVEPKLNIIVNPDGKANYDILKNSDPEEQPSGSKDINLSNYSILNGTLKYTDHQSSTGIIITNLNHKGQGNFRSRNFILKTKTEVEKLTYESAGIPLAKDLKIDWDADFKINLDKMFFQISENKLKINDLLLVSEGTFRKNENDLDIDMKIKAPGTDFKQLFSLIPNAYIREFKDVKAEGKFSFSGFVKGKYGLNTEEFPDFDFSIKAERGYVKYPSLSLPVQDIFADIRIFKTDKSIDETIINIAPLTFSVGGETFLIKMLVADMTSDPVTNGEIRGTLNLDALSRAFPMQDVKKLSGKVVADIVFNVSKSLFRKNLKGNAKLEDIKLRYSDLPDINISSMNAVFSNDQILCSGIAAQAGKSDITGIVKIINPLYYNFKGKPVTIIIDSKSRSIDADEWVSSETTTSQNDALEDYSGIIDLLNNKLIIKYNVNFGDLKFEDYDIKDISASGSLSNNTLSLDKTNLLFSGSKISVDGKLKQFISWALDDKELNGFLNISSPYFDVDKYLASGESQSQTADSEEQFSLPGKMNLDIRTDIARMSYTGKELTDLKGNLVLNDQKISFDNFGARGFGGEFDAAGFFDAKQGKLPEYNVNLDLKTMKYEQLYKQVTSFSALLPVVKFINGVFNAEFNVKGRLKNDLSPILETINAIGILETVNGLVQSFPGMNEAAGKLNLPVMNNLKLNDVKGRFEITDGNVKVNPFDVKYQDILFNISGINRLDKTIDYIIHTKIPRSEFEKMPVGKNINSGLVLITEQAKSKGLDINAGEFVNIDILISGPVLKPKVKLEYRGGEGKSVKKAIENKAESVIDDTKKKLENEFDTRKKEAENKANEIIDSTKKQAEEKAREAVEDLKKKAQKELENTLDSTAKKKANDVLNQYNPFKKKK